MFFLLLLPFLLPLLSGCTEAGAGGILSSLLGGGGTLLGGTFGDSGSSSPWSESSGGDSLFETSFGLGSGDSLGSSSNSSDPFSSGSSDTFTSLGESGLGGNSESGNLGDNGDIGSLSHSPEPGSLFLFGSGLMGSALFRSRFRRFFKNRRSIS